MKSIEEKFSKLGVENAPGQEVLQQHTTQLEEHLTRGEKLPGTPVDFSHGDVDAFPPVANAHTHFENGVAEGGAQAYTEYRGRGQLREDLATKLSQFTGTEVDPGSELILTPGTQGALFLALSALVMPADRVAIVDPDYFANRKIVEFLGATPVPVKLNFEDLSQEPELDLKGLEETFKAGVKVFVFSNPNNPTGVIYREQQIQHIANLAETYDVTVVVDQLYSRQIFGEVPFSHLRAQPGMRSRTITLMGPSKTESMSGYRVGTAMGPAPLIDRMEKVQAITTLRAGGYNQAVLQAWFNEPEGWLAQRTQKHREIRDNIVGLLESAGNGFSVRITEGGSYIYPELPELTVPQETFVSLLRKQAGVTVTPGSEFTSQPTRRVRLNFSQDKHSAISAVERLIELAQRYR